MLKVFLSKTFIFRQILQRRKNCLRNFHLYTSIQESAVEATLYQDHPPWSVVRTGRLAEVCRVWRQALGVGLQRGGVSILLSGNPSRSGLRCRQLHLFICLSPWNSTMDVPQPFLFLEIVEALALPNLQNGGNLTANKSFHSSFVDYPFLVCLFFSLHLYSHIFSFLFLKHIKIVF